MIKNYVIDTNVMIHDPSFLTSFSDNNVIIPLVAIEELDNLKRREGLVGFNARNVAKELQILMLKGDIQKGIKLENGGTVRVELNHLDTSVLPNGVDTSKNDSKIIAVTLNLQKAEEIPTILVTKDLYMSIKASSLGVKVEDYQNDKIMTEDVYTGYMDYEMLSDQINLIYSGGLDLPEDLVGKVYPNEFIHIRSSDKQGHEVLSKFDGKRIVPLKYVMEKAWGLTPINC